MSLDDSIQETDERLEIGGLTVLMDKNFYQKIGDNLKIDFVEGQGITVERIES